MPRRPCERELLTTLAAAVESDDAEVELAALLEEHGRTIATLLCLSPAQLEAACKAPPMDRTVKVRVALRRARERNAAALRLQAQARSIEAAEILARHARWHAEHVELDHRVVLGTLLADSQRKAIRFDVQGRTCVTVTRAKLKETSRALVFSGLRCFIDERGLNFRWHGGRGGLVLVSQGFPVTDAGAVLTVELQKPRQLAERTPPAHVPTFRRQTPTWLGDLLLEFGFL